MFDRGDGLVGRLGVATPAGTIRVQTSGGGTTVNDAKMAEMPDSPQIERAEQCTVVKRFKGGYNDALTRIAGLYRGLVRVDSLGNVSQLLSTKLEREGAGMATLTTVEESKSFDPPPEEFFIDTVELNVPITRNPRYLNAFLGANSAEELLNQQVLRQLELYFENPTLPTRNGVVTALEASKGHPSDPDNFVTGTDMAKYAALEIIQKYWRGTETPYLPGVMVTWSQYGWLPWNLNFGAYIENPMTTAVPQLPDYFFSTVYPPDPAITIFDDVAKRNPQYYSTDGTATGALNISWLRKADRMERARTWYRIDRTWIGSPLGYWDPELYSAGNRPSVVTDYKAINPTDIKI